MLHNHKEAGLALTEDELIQLQTSIENLTTQFDDFKNVYQIAPDLIRLMVCQEINYGLAFN